MVIVALLSYLASSSVKLARHSLLICPTFVQRTALSSLWFTASPFSFLEANSETLLREQPRRLTPSCPTWRGCT
jgi:hypothetical protein